MDALAGYVYREIKSRFLLIRESGMSAVSMFEKDSWRNPVVASSSVVKQGHASCCVGSSLSFLLIREIENGDTLEQDQGALKETERLNIYSVVWTIGAQDDFSAGVHANAVPSSGNMSFPLCGNPRHVHFIESRISQRWRGHIIVINFTEVDVYIRAHESDRKLPSISAL